MAWRKFTLLAIGVTANSIALAGNLYCCSDASSGRRVCADQVPEQCKGKGYKVFDGLGNVIQEVGPPLTPEQKAKLEEEKKRKQELEAAQREQRRKDSALFETYTSLQDIDRLRARAEEEFSESMKLVEKRIADVVLRRKKFEDEAEFYKKKELPVEVARGLKDADNEIKAQQALLNSKQKDLETLRAKYAEDRRRYVEITSGAVKTQRNTSPATPQDN